ncbi:flavin monoamine oxidase family protein [Moorena producens JHB]|uniref:Flavin monoamine oxidase family protein n=1 Tax=Moorena producens (strain JHB) TaxID=1454205 RepID=A0A1D9FWZ4_MOOP1|nr:flavin monoamine oxidase family protein [Moorena producens]AOY79889.1 flavin monoamine oxidase family protein [Moorena producens JHB]
MNRRTLLRLVGRAGGVAAVLTTMKAMGLLHSAATGSERPDLPASSGDGVKVAILGAGIAGMIAGYELSKAGYECIILEARPRAGGRCWTIRGGDIIRELDTEQSCRFELADYLYMNPGPARIPHSHQGVLGYCKEFGVPLQVIVNENRACYFQDDNAFDGEPILNRRVVNDSRGYIAELLAKAISQNALEQQVSVDDQERIIEMVKRFGRLNADLLYTGSSRAGYTEARGAGLKSGKIYDPINFSELLKSDFWEYKMNVSEGYTHSATMLEPVGGMDQIAKAFEQRVSNLIRYNAEVTQIRKTGSGVRLVYTDKTSGDEAKLDTNFAICTIPLSVLNTLDTDFSRDYQDAIAIAAKSYVRAVKHGFQSKRRFWEEDYQIYGGISWTTRDITQIWYPAVGFHQPTGIIIGGYILNNQICDRVAAMPIAERLKTAVEEGKAIHPSYGDEVNLDTGVSVAWGKIPYSLGSWIQWQQDARETAYRVLNEPDGPIYFAGEHMSYWTGWQEGAVLSAHEAVRGISARLQAMRA